MILTVGNTKGGVGKTTLAVNLTVALAIAGLDVLLIDGDEQGTATAFTELRSSQGPECRIYTAVALHGAAIRTQVRQLRPKYDHIVIDVAAAIQAACAPPSLFQTAFSFQPRPAALTFGASIKPPIWCERRAN